MYTDGKTNARIKFVQTVCLTRQPPFASQYIGLIANPSSFSCQNAYPETIGVLCFYAPPFH